MSLLAHRIYKPDEQLDQIEARRVVLTQWAAYLGASQ